MPTNKTIVQNYIAILNTYWKVIKKSINLKKKRSILNIKNNWFSNYKVLSNSY